MARPLNSPTAAGQPGADQPPARRRWSFPFARVFGIPIRIHFSFFLIVAIFWAGSTAPGGMGPANAMLWLVIVFTSVTVHELSHGTVANSRGIRVRAIVLLPIGGVSELESTNDSPRDEFAISIAGPLASLAIAGIAAMLAASAGYPLLPIDLVGGPLVPRILWFNLTIAAFNLLPAFPLDGGRLLRSVLERRSNRETATRLAARTGRTFAVFMAIAGLYLNPWLIVIGVFVWFAATAEEAATVVHARLRDRYVRDVMLEGPIVIDAREPIEHLVAIARHSAQREFPVVEDGRYAGLASLYAFDDVPIGATVGDITNRNAPTVLPDSLLEDDAVARLDGTLVEALPVVEDGRIVGLLRAADLAHLMRRRAA